MAAVKDLSLGASGEAPVDAGRSTDTPLEAIAPMVDALRASFDAGAVRSNDARIAQLQTLQRLVDENLEDIVEAVHTDLRRHRSFTRKTLGGCSRACTLAIDNLSTWTAPKVTLQENGVTQQVRLTPRGVVCIIVPWNFPNPLAIKPLATALAAGNTVLLKLSEVCPTISNQLASLIGRYFDPAIVNVVQGAVPQATAVLAQKYDLIFYTGNSAVGRIVMQAAAKHLTPVILELGGKNPVFVTESADIDVAARKIIDGRMKNAGQFCVAPDYVLAAPAVYDALLEKLKTAIVDFFGQDPRTSESFSRIINARHTARIASLLEDHGGVLEVGGESDVSERFVAPTIVSNPRLDSKLMQEEIFGPVLPVLRMDTEQALKFVRGKPEPLALYVFGADAAAWEPIVDAVRSGGVCINDVIVHMLNETLPFGGCGESGMGSYHGEWGFKAFSHERAVMVVEANADAPARYPPYA